VRSRQDIERRRFDQSAFANAGPSWRMCFIWSNQLVAFSKGVRPAAG
jgi:hypothetical protein